MELLYRATSKTQARKKAIESSRHKDDEMYAFLVRHYGARVKFNPNRRIRHQALVNVEKAKKWNKRLRDKIRHDGYNPAPDMSRPHNFGGYPVVSRKHELVYVIPCNLSFMCLTKLCGNNYAQSAYKMPEWPTIE